MTAEEVIKRAIKVVKGAKVYMRVFPDIPVCIKVRASSARATSVELNGHVCRVTKRAWGRGRGRSNFGQLGTF
jgi:ribosomal protein L16/L10AE